jgi:hypothetical protein
MSTLRADTIANVAGTENKGILQVQSTCKLDTFTTTSSSFTDVTGLTVSITPRATSSKILILTAFSLVNSASSYSAARLMRDSTVISLGNANSSNVQGSILYYGNVSYEGTYEVNGSSIVHVDSPSSTSAIAYHIEVCSNASSGTTTVGMRGDNPSDVSGLRAASNIIVMEIQG